MRRIVRVWVVYETQPRTITNVTGEWAGELQKYSYMQGKIY